MFLIEERLRETAGKIEFQGLHCPDLSQSDMVRMLKKKIQNLTNWKESYEAIRRETNSKLSQQLLLIIIIIDSYCQNAIDLLIRRTSKIL